MTGYEEFYDEDLLEMSQARLIGEVIKLRYAIRRHRDAKDNDRCWENDIELAKFLPEGKFNPPEPMNGTEEELLNNCREYIRCQKERMKQCPTPP